MTREEAINILKHWADGLWMDEHGITNGDFDIAIDIACKALNPSNSCKSDKNLQELTWHKVSEELPSSEGDYIIAYNLPDGIKTYIDMASFHDNIWFPTRHFKNMDIIAWMPIPKIKED